jgi:hypothetical protein
MTEPLRPSGNPNEDVMSAIQAAIDAPRLPFPGRNLRRGTEPDSLEGRITKLEAEIEFHRNIAEIRTELQIIRANVRAGFRLIFAALIAIALGLAWLLAAHSISTMAKPAEAAVIRTGHCPRILDGRSPPTLMETRSTCSGNFRKRYVRHIAYGALESVRDHDVF